MIFCFTRLIMMKHKIYIGMGMAALAFVALCPQSIHGQRKKETDSVCLFSYCKDKGRSGLRFAWHDGSGEWRTVNTDSSRRSEGFDFVKSDFGPWGSHKKMYDPRLFRIPGGWRAVWYVSDLRETLAVAESPDLISWGPQRYVSAKGSDYDTCGVAASERSTQTVGGRTRSGEVRKVPRAVVEKLERYMADRREKASFNSEVMKDDSLRFSCLGALSATARPRKGATPLRVSDKLIGIFFEDISMAADGGLYAELVQNRDFEYRPDENGKKGWGPGYAWTLTDAAGNPAEMVFSSELPLHANNAVYLSLTGHSGKMSLKNEGFDGITLKKGKKYDFSVYTRGKGKKGVRRFDVRLVSPSGKTLASGSVKASGGGWTRSELTLTPKDDVGGASLRIEIPSGVAMDIDMVSLFPRDTYKGRRNGLRKDLAETLEALNPRFVRFPGGCVAHGDGIDNIYDWKGSVGPLYARKPLRNIWNYHQTRGLGFHEYFLFCEDLGAEPLPVLAAGVPCQNSGRAHSGSHDELTGKGQQCGIPMSEMDAYVRDILDLIEYANGTVDSRYGRMRAEAGHPEPFGLRYIGIGNEDMITDVFKERFKYIHDIIRKKHPELTVVGTVGPFYEGTDYEEGWKFARKENVAMVDEHYYVEPGWFINNRDFYDSYDRNGPKVYLGEYASHLGSRKNTLETALSVALYLTDVERNADVVEMTSYAPLFAKEKHVNWRPDLIYFTNDSVRLTPDYYVQSMFGQNAGTHYLPVDVDLSDSGTDVRKRFGHSAMIDSSTGDLILKIANLLPVSVDFSETLPAGIPDEGQGKVTVLSGNPDDECTKPETSYVSFEKGILKFKAMPYSFSVVRISAK